MLSVLLSLPVFAAALQNPPPPPICREEERRAETQWARGRSFQACLTYREILVRIARELNAAATPADRLRLQADFEHILLRVEDILEPLGAFQFQFDLLSGLELDPEAGFAWSALAIRRMRLAGRLGLDTDTQQSELGLLRAWQWVGPFNNDRGAAFDGPLPPESAPASEQRYAGKERETGWRELPPPPPTGVLRFTELMRPSEQVAWLARTWIEVPQATDAWLLLGVDDEVRVWHQDAAIYETRGRRPLRPDAHAIPLELVAGWNRIGLKLGNRDGDGSLIARLTDAEGRPLRLSSQAERPDGVAWQAWPEVSARWDEQSLPPAPGPADYYAQQAESAETLYRKSVREQRLHRHAMSGHPGRSDALAAYRSKPDELRYVLQRIRSLRDTSPVAEERDPNPWRQAIEELIRNDPELARPWYWLGHYARVDLPTHKRSLQQLDRALELEPEFIEARWERARLFQDRGDAVLAQRDDRQWLQLEYGLHALFLSDSALGTLENEIPGSARAWAREFDRISPRSVGVAGRLTMNGDDGSVEAVQRAFETENRRRPWEVMLHKEAAQLFRTRGASDRALLVLGEALELCPEDTALWRQSVHARLARGDREGALEALDQLAQLDYEDTNAQRLLDWLKSRGTGSFEEAFREPLDQILTRHAEPATGDEAEEVLLYRTVMRAQPDGTARRYMRQVHRLLTVEGARRLATVRIPYAAGDQELRLLRAEVLHEDGTRSRARTRRSRRTSGWRSFVVVMPPLSPGDVVDLEWRLDDLHPTFFGRYFGIQHSFYPQVGSQAVPVRESELVLDSAPGLPLTVRSNTSADTTQDELEDGWMRRTYRVTGLLPPQPESLMPPAREWAPMVRASSYPDWTAFGNWWWNLIEPEMKVSPEIRAKVAELTEGLEQPEQRLRAIYDFIVTDIRYNAWEFGVHGYQPYSAPVIFNRGFGDCKDKSILMRTMLAEAGIESYPVLIYADSRRHEEDHAVPLVGHFNHCISYLPTQEGITERYLDGTARHHPLEVLPSSDAGASVLVVKPEGAEMARIPFPEAESNQDRHEYWVDVLPDGSAFVQVEERPRGRFDPSLRNRFGGTEDEQRHAAERRLSQRFGAVDLIDTSTSPLEDLGQAPWWRAQARVGSLARVETNRLALPAVIEPARLLETLAVEAERRQDLLLDVPWSQETLLHYRLPEGWKPLELPPAQTFENEDIRWEWKAELHGNELRIHESWVLRSHRIPADRYPAFRELLRQIDAGQSQQLTIFEGESR